jgi:hypothetical protein
MTDYTVDRYDWSKVDTEAIDGDPFARCILELRARIEALEAAQQPPQDKMDRLTAIDRKERWPEFSDCNYFEEVWAFNPVLNHWKLTRINPSIHTHWLPHWTLPMPTTVNTNLEGT